jgi:hypothetical protein
MFYWRNAPIALRLWIWGYRYVRAAAFSLSVLVHFGSYNSGVFGRLHLYFYKGVQTC